MAEIRQAQGEAALIRRESAIENTHAEGHDGTTPHALDDAEEDERVYVPGQPTQCRAGDEEECGEDEQALRSQPSSQPSNRWDENGLMI